MARPFDFLTLDDVDVRGKRVFLRVDVNSPVNAGGRILDDRRVRSIVPTLVSLAGAKVALTSHQGRPGRSDFTSLEAHARLLRELIGDRVTFVPDVIGPAALQSIRELEDGQVLVLDNVRFCSEELLEGVPEQLAKTHLIRRLAPLFDLFVNDAFAAAHRSQPSLVGFVHVLPAVAGRVMEAELKALNRLLHAPRRPFVAVLGGAKVEDKVPATKHLLERGVADKVLVGGLAGATFLKAAGFSLGSEAEAPLQGAYVEQAREVLSRFRDRVVMPTDVAWQEGGERVEGPVGRPAGGAIKDVGEGTVESFSRVIAEAGTVVSVGPLGVFEAESFGWATRKLLEAMTESDAFTVVGGGHLHAVARSMGIEGKVDHISTGGGALLYALAGRAMPVFEALRGAAAKIRAR